MVEQLNYIAGLWWDWSVAMFWQVGLLILLIASIDRLVRRWAWPQLRYALWSLVLIKLILPPSLSLPSAIVPGLRPVVRQVLQRLELDKPAAGPSSDCGLQIADLSRSAYLLSEPVYQYPIRPGDTDGEVGIADASLSANPQSAIAIPPLEWPVYAMATWLFGTSILGIWLFTRLHSLRGRHAYKAAAASLPQSFYNRMADCASRLGLRRVPQVAVTRRLSNPAVFGIVRPVLLMPKGYLSKLSRRDTEHMLLHELAHIKRGDLVTHSLYMLLQIVYWYNPLLWLVRRQVHHLRELSCDATVANLLRERTTAYRQTLLETARRLLATSAEPGLGLLGLFEDSNRLVVRLNWLTKPTWRYRTMKRATVITIAVLMFACVLPMARAQEALSHREEPVVTEQDAQLSRQIAEMEVRLQQLRAEQEQLQNNLRLLNERRQPPAGRRAQGPRSPVAGGGQRRERSAGEIDVMVMPREARTHVEGRDGGQPGGPEEIERARVGRIRAEVEARAARTARAAAGGRRAEVQRQEEWAGEWGDQLRQWEQSEQMQQWRKDMEQWQKQMKEWARAQARRSMDAADVDGKEPAPPAPIPPMPAMPPIPAPMHTPASLQEDFDIEVQVPDAKVQSHEPGIPAPPTTGTVPHEKLKHLDAEMQRLQEQRSKLEEQQGELRRHSTELTRHQNSEDLEEAVSIQRVTESLSPDQTLEIANEFGSITARGGDGDTVQIVATIKGKAETVDEARAIADQARFDIKRSEGKLSIAMTRPEQAEQLEKINRQVDFEVIVPRNARIKVSQSFGDVRLNDLSGSIKAASNMGSIHAVGVSGQVALAANFGNIDFIAPRDLSAKVQANAQFGSVQSKLPVKVMKPGEFSMGSQASGVLGGGEGNIALTTNMGSIHIRTAEPSRASR